MKRDNNQEMKSVPPFKSVNTSSFNGLRGLISVYLMVFHTLLWTKYRIDILGSVQMSWFFFISGIILTINESPKLEKQQQQQQLPETHVAKKCFANKKHFYQRRFARIMPVFWLINLIYIPTIYLGYNNMVEGVYINKDSILRIISYILTFFASTTWFGIPITVVFVSWFVSTIIFFYLTFPYLLVYVEKLVLVRVSADKDKDSTAEKNRIGIYEQVIWNLVKKLYLFQILFAILIVIVCYTIFFIFDINHNHGIGPGYYAFWIATYWPIGRLPLFIMAILIGLLIMYTLSENNDHDHDNGQKQKESENDIEKNIKVYVDTVNYDKECTKLGIKIGVVYLFGIIGENICYQMLDKFILGGNFILQLILPLWQLKFLYILTKLSKESQNKIYLFLTNKYILYFGKISYVLFLIHQPVTDYLIWLVNEISYFKFFNDNDKIRLPIVCVPMVWIIAIIISIIIHKWFEVPLRNYFRPPNINEYSHKHSFIVRFLLWCDLQVAYIIVCKIFDKQDKCVAPISKQITHEWIKPVVKNPEIKRIGNKDTDDDDNDDNDDSSKICQITAYEQYLTLLPVNYSFFYDYYIEYQEIRDALSRLLSKIPIIGGIYYPIDEEKFGINYTNPKIEFIVYKTSEIPSVDDKDFEKSNWYNKFMNGVSRKFPYPRDEHVFRVTVIYYNKNDADEIIITDIDDVDNSQQQAQDLQRHGQQQQQCTGSTLIAVGCSHGLVDGAGLFLLMRAFAAEMRYENYIVPYFDRSKLLIDDSQLKKFDKHSALMGKSYEYTTKAAPWISIIPMVARRWRPKTFIFNKKEIADLKQVALNGSMGEKLKTMRVSTNDVLVSLFWKCRALLNNGYSYNDPIIVSMVINHRQRLKERFINSASEDDEKSKNNDDRISIETKSDLNYLGAPISILLLSKTRRELIDADFSQICYWVREKITKLTKEDFENDLHFWQWCMKRGYNGINSLHLYHTRMSVNGYGFDHGRFLVDRDLVISNLSSIDTLNGLHLKKELDEENINVNNSNCNYNPSRIRFNFVSDGAQMNYVFKLDPNGNNIEYYGLFPQNDVETFYNIVNIKDPNLDWKKLALIYSSETKRCITKYPLPRAPIINFKNICDGRKDTQFVKL